MAYTRQHGGSTVCLASPEDIPGWSRLTPSERWSINRMTPDSAPLSMAMATVPGGFRVTLDACGWFSYQLVSCGALTPFTFRKATFDHQLTRCDHKLVSRLLGQWGVRSIFVKSIRQIIVRTSPEFETFKGVGTVVDAIATRLKWHGHRVQLTALDKPMCNSLKHTPNLVRPLGSDLFITVPEGVYGDGTGALLSVTN